MERPGAELLQKYFDGSLNDEEAGRLLALLKTDSAFSGTACEQYEIEHDIRFLGLRHSTPFPPLPPPPPPAGMMQVYALPINRLPRTAAAPSRFELEMATASGGDREPAKRRKGWPYKTDRIDRLFTAVFCSFCLLGIILFLSSFKESGRRDGSITTWKYQPLATVGAVVDPVFSQEDGGIKPGQTLAADEIKLESGTVALTLSNGVNLILEGPLDFQLLSPTKTFCRLGKISVSVPPQGRGFEIASPDFSVIDLGTEFVFEKTPEFSEVHTIKGKVEISDRISQRTPVPQGKAFQFLPAKAEFRKMNAEPTKFTLPDAVQETFLRLLTAREEARNAHAETLRERPGTLIHFDFEKNAQIVANRVPHAEQYSGTPYVVRHGSGEHPNGGAMGFFNDTSRVELTVPQSLRSMTLVATIKPTSLDRFVHCLLVSRSVEPGSLVWQIAGDGNLQFGVRAGREGRETRFVSASCFHPRNLGAWYTIATVVDAATSEIRHYRDGREIGRATVQDLPAIRPGAMTLGNGFWSSKTLSRRQFDGWFDDFYFFDRALTEREIEELSLNK